MIIRWLPIYTSTELPVSLLGGPRPAAAAGCSVVGFKLCWANWYRPLLFGKWITHPPAHCPNGHTLGPGEVLVGHQACLGHGGGHTTRHCRTCDAVVVHGPPLNTHCTAL